MPFCYLKDGGVTFVSGNVELPDGSDIEKYIFAAFVVPKSLFEPLFCTLLNASRNIAL